MSSPMRTRTRCRPCRAATLAKAMMVRRGAMSRMLTHHSCDEADIERQTPWTKVGASFSFAHNRTTSRDRLRQRDGHEWLTDSRTLAARAAGHGVTEECSSKPLCEANRRASPRTRPRSRRAQRGAA